MSSAKEKYAKKTNDADKEEFGTELYGY